MLKILKASAGAGKTYQLAQEYIRLLVKTEDPLAYRHVLAVTFTNKATDEMKSRILKELDKLAKNPLSSKYLGELLPECGGSVALLQERARTQLSGILHDYSAFAVSTIDKFFLQTLRAFSREVGQFSSYQIQLDRQALVEESVDLVLDGLKEDDDTLLAWLTESARGDLARTGRFSLESNLLSMAASLRDLPSGAPSPTHSEVRELYGICKDIREKFESDVTGAAGDIVSLFKLKGISLEETSGRWIKATIEKCLRPETITYPTPTFFATAPDSSKWFAKDKSKEKYRVLLEGSLEGLLSSFLDLFGQRYTDYCTARIIMRQVYSLGVADILRKAFADVQKDNNVLALEDSNTILRGIIDGTDTPFIYEKMGVRFDDFLLDEFQDTSDVQWENFLPLIRGSESTGGHSLVVGDVKQSIYRFRGSDWSLLGSRIGMQFPRALTTPLDGNYRTCPKIVYFNNDFFRYAAAQLDGLLGLDPTGPESISFIYDGVKQEPKMTDKGPGLVEAVFTPDQKEEVVSSVKNLLERGVRYNQIAVLVRNNSDGSTVASALLSEGIPVVSDDSLFVKASLTVRRLVSQMSLVAYPPDPEKKLPSDGFLGKEIGTDVPADFHSLQDLAESLLRGIRDADSARFASEIPYIQAFMDYLKDWTATGGNNIASFLHAWKDASPKISSPSSGNSVRVITIHKAKGLEFPFVIFPFAESVTLYRPSSYWCEPDQTENSALEGKAGGFYQVSLDGGAAHSLFSGRYGKEVRLQAIDNVNIFYVALTRAIFGLKVIAAPPANEIVNAVKKGGAAAWKNLSHLLYGFVKTTSFFSGTFTLPPPDEDPGVETAVLGYPSYPSESGGRLSYSKEAEDYFGEDGTYGREASARIRGNVIHDILAQVVVEEDVPAAVKAAVDGGSLPASAQKETLDLLHSRLACVRERGWFSPEAKVLRETAIIDPVDGFERRPDRVVIHPDGRVTVVDYKTGGQEEEYFTQVNRYVNLYRAMGYADVKGYLWYLADGTVTESCPDNRI